MAAETAQSSPPAAAAAASPQEPDVTASDAQEHPPLQIDEVSYIDLLEYYF